MTEQNQSDDVVETAPAEEAATDSAETASDAEKSADEATEDTGGEG